MPNGAYKAEIITKGNDNVIVFGAKKNDMTKIVNFWTELPHYTREASYLRI